jgi:hypothetical protein
MYSSTTLVRPPFYNEKVAYKRVATLEEDNLVVFTVCAYEILPDKSGCLWWRWSDKSRATTV